MNLFISCTHNNEENDDEDNDKKEKRQHQSSVNPLNIESNEY